MRWVTHDEQLDLPGIPALDVWPEYNLHADVVGALWSRLHTEVPKFQSVCWDEDSGTVLAEANTVPCWWDGTDDGLGSGIDEMMTDAFVRLDRGQTANTLCALAAKVAPAARSRGLAADTLRQMLRVAAAHGLTAVIAPVRPLPDVLGLPQLESYTHDGGHVAAKATLEINDPVYAEYIDAVEVGRRVAGHIRVALE
jgi:hypothetical protein